MFFSSKPNTVDAALAPLLQVQANLETVAATRKADAEAKRDQAKVLMSEARADEDQQLRANLILEKLTKLLDPLEE